MYPTFAHREAIKIHKTYHTKTIRTRESLGSVDGDHFPFHKSYVVECIVGERTGDGTRNELAVLVRHDDRGLRGVPDVMAILERAWVWIDLLWGGVSGYVEGVHSLEYDRVAGCKSNV